MGQRTLVLGNCGDTDESKDDDTSCFRLADGGCVADACCT